MMTTKERCRMAMEYHERKLSCGQSVLLAFSDMTGLSEEQSIGLATGFGNGMRCGSLCGVISAAVVVLGMLYPATPENGAEGKRRSTRLVQEYQRRFTEQFHNLNCRDLMADKELEGTAIAQELGVTQHCRLLVTSGVELLCDMLDHLDEQGEPEAQ